MNKEPLGILVMAYGTPGSLDEVLPYYTDIRHGHAPSPEQLAELTDRYIAIGGISPLTEITSGQAYGLEEALNRDGGRQVKVYLGFKHIKPTITDAVKQMHEDGIQEAVCLVLAPHYSAMSVGTYHKTATEAANTLGGPKLLTIDSWHMHPAFLDVLASHVKAALSRFASEDDVMVVFSAHSLPARILTVGDPYEKQLHESGEAVAKMLNLKHYTFAWQSAGRTSEPWLGPDILDKLAELKEEGYDKIVSCSQGFVSDHLEVLYDIDIEAMEKAKLLGIKLVRTEQMNTDSKFLQALAQVVRDCVVEETANRA
jgi:protoporphyrin/coproporphyrin ferrochelatase